MKPWFRGFNGKLQQNKFKWRMKYYSRVNLKN